MKLIFAEKAWEDYLYWQKTDKKMLNRINTLIKDIGAVDQHDHGAVHGATHALSGYWSRRINDEHRIVYKIHQDSLLLAQLRYHY